MLPVTREIFGVSREDLASVLYVSEVHQRKAWQEIRECGDAAEVLHP